MVKFNKLEITSDGASLLIDVSVKSDYYYKDVYLDSIYIDSFLTYSRDFRPSGIAIKKRVGTIFIDDKEYMPVFIPVESEDGATIKYNLPFPMEDIGDYAISFGLIQNPNRQVTLTDSNGVSIILGTFLDTLGSSYDYIMKYEDGDLPRVTISRKWYRDYDNPTLFEDKKSITLSLSVKDLLQLLEMDKSSKTDNPLFVVYVKTKGTPSIDTPCGQDSEYTMGVAINKCPLLNYILETANELDGSCIIPRTFINGLLQYEAFLLSVKTGNYDKALYYWEKFFNKRAFKAPTKTCGCHGL